MDDQSNLYTPPPDPDANRTAKLLRMVVIVVLVAAAFAAFYYYSQSNKSSKPQEIPAHFTDTHGNTFDEKPISVFPQELILKDGQVLQYFDNTVYTGVLYKINQNFSAIADSYKQQLAQTDWSFAPQATTTRNRIITLVNKTTQKTARITLDVISKDVSTVTVAAQK